MRYRRRTYDWFIVVFVLAIIASIAVTFWIAKKDPACLLAEDSVGCVLIREGHRE